VVDCRHESLLSQAPPRAHHAHQAASHLHRHHQQHQQPSPIYSPPGSGQFYAGGGSGFVDISSPPSTPPGHFRFPSSAAMLGYRACQPPPPPQQPQHHHQSHHQKRRPELAVMTARAGYAHDKAQMSPPMSAAERMTLDMR